MILALLACVQDFPDRDVHDFDGDGVGADVDCDDTDPKNVEVAMLLYIDADGDEYGGNKTITTCHPPSNAVKYGGDCDDTDAGNFVGNEEVCDQRDNDCDDDIDEDAPARPEEFEVCGDGIDTNCDGSCGDCCFEGDNVVTDAPFALFSTGAFGSLGRAVVATDVSGTTASFAAGSPREEVVFLVPATTLGGKSSRIDVDDPTSRNVLGVVHGSTKDSYFGTALAAIDGGGILVGAPGAQEVVGKDITNGAVYRIDADVIAGSELGVDARDVVLYATGADPTFFGSAILPGPNFGREPDEEPDIVVSGVNEAFEGKSFSSGAVWVFYDALAGSPSNSDLITGSDVQAGFGASIAAGDLNSDGTADLLIAESAPDVASAAQVYVFLGGDRFGTVTDADADFSFTSLPAGANLGASLALGDFDDSGSIDIAAGAPNPGSVGTENATVHVYLNDTDWWQVSKKTGELDDVFLDQDDLTFVGTENDRTGTALVAEDLDLDGFDDLLIGSPGVQGGGKTYLVRMPLTGLIGPDDVVSSWSVGSGAPDELGFALSAASFGQDVWPDVLLSAPGDRTVYVWNSAGP